MTSVKKTIVLCAGEGGHLEQMRRLCILLSESKQVTPICVGERRRIEDDIVSPFENYISRISKTKGGFRFLLLIFIFVPTFLWACLVLFRLKPVGIVFHGPMFCIPIMLASKLMCIKGVFIESWSRFTSATHTGRLAVRMGFPILYQNLSMEKVYPNGVYCGRL